MSLEDELLGYVVVEDTLKNNILEDLKALKKGIKLTLLSGDKNKNVKRVAEELRGIENFRRIVTGW